MFSVDRIDGQGLQLIASAATHQDIREPGRCNCNRPGITYFSDLDRKLRTWWDVGDD